MIIEDYAYKFWRYLAVAGALAIFFGASVFIVTTLPPRELVMATGAEGDANYELGIQYREILAKEGVKLRLLRQYGKSATSTRPAVGGKRRIHTGWHRNQEGSSGARIARHRVLRAAMAFPPR